jgi:hypothetical protein
MTSNSLPQGAGTTELPMELQDIPPQRPPSPEGPPAELSDVDRILIAWLKRRMARARWNSWIQWTREKFHLIEDAGGWVGAKIGSADSKGPWNLLGFVLAIITVIFGTSEYFRLKEPTLQASMQQTAAAMAQGAAAEWANYQTWIMQVCPDELVCFSANLEHGSPLVLTPSPGS